MRPAAIEAARQQHRLVDVAERTGVELPKRTGSTSVHCPFPKHGHYDQRPSMHLNLDRGTFHCFGCNLSGDVVEWVRRSEQVTWPEAVAILDSGRPLTNTWAPSGHLGSGAVRESHPRAADGSAPPAPDLRGAGAQAAERPNPERTPADRVFAAMGAAWRFVSGGTLHDQGAEYLTRRGIDVAVLEAHIGRREVGHTPDVADGLVRALTGAGFTADELIDAGLARRALRSGPLTDFFRNRVLIPIRSAEGRVCAFNGRNIGDDRWPKYLNPPRTAAYDKSVDLYQPLPAPAHPHGQVIVVEGTLDALAVACAAIRAGQGDRLCPVTQSGTQLSAAQLFRVLELSAEPPLIAFDGDHAGREATARLRQRISDRGHDAEIAPIPEGHDPASLLAEQGQAGLIPFLPAIEPAREPEPHAALQHRQPTPTRTMPASWQAQEPLAMFRAGMGL